MKGRFKIRNLIILLLVFSGCRKDQWNDCFQGTGKEITVIRKVEPFTKIKAGEKFEILLTQDTTQNEEIKITAGSHIIGQITTRVKDNKLTIENKNTCNFVRSYKRKILIEIRVKYLDDIEIYSASNLTSKDTLHFEKSNYLKLKNYGLGDINIKIKLGFLDVQSINSGNIFLEGFSNIFSCSIEEASQLHACKLLCDDIYIDCHTPLDCYVNPKIKLYANIFYKGNVFYKNTPSDTTKLKLVIKRGTGQLLKGGCL